MVATKEQASRAFRKVSEQAERIANDAEQRIELMDLGDEVRQGDVYVTKIKVVPASAVLAEKPEAQLAPGTTQGSRHCLRSLEGLKLYRLTDAGPLDGPIIDAPAGCAIDHPEHANFILPPGTYAITYQRAFADELRRVED